MVAGCMKIKYAFINELMILCLFQGFEVWGSCCVKLEMMGKCEREELSFSFFLLLM